MQINVKSAPHRKIAVEDILPNPHRDFKANPVSPERIDQLIESFDRTGFWDNVVVREHPTREGKFELAYGHNRWTALKDKRVNVDTITIPVAKLSDWDMYCAMVDENELQGAITPAVQMENINVGCDLIERALKKIGKNGTWEDFNEAMGRSVSADTERGENDHGFELARTAFFEGEGLGRRFVSEFLPGGKVRSNTLSTVLDSRYAEQREKAKRAQAKVQEELARAKEKLARETEEKEERERLEQEAAEAKAAAKKLEDAAIKIGKGGIDKKILLMFDASRTMSDFAQAVRKLDIDKKHHKAAAEYIIEIKVKEERIRSELDIWWDDVSGASAARRKQAQIEQENEKFRRATQGKDPVDYLLKIIDDLKIIEPRIKMVTEHVHLFGSRERNLIRGKIAEFSDLLQDLLERERETLGEKNITPAKKMLSHRKG